ncbi:MAG: hypothetical protein H6998_20695 [Hahellaceae bacterium]|nr:hypothetical protein [Hahellaceae bacterium]
MIDDKRGGCFVYTSNVDGHFQRSGFSPASIYECHGSIFKYQCAGRCTKNVWGLHGHAMYSKTEIFGVINKQKCIGLSSMRGSSAA